VLADLLLVAWVLTRRFFPEPAAQPAEDAFGGRTPLVSVIVPVLNEQDTVYRTVQSLHDQTYPHIEIIFVDDGSSDETPRMCRELVARYPNVRHFQSTERSGKSAALNLGARYARGEVLCFVDADTTFDRDSIAQVLAQLRDPRVGCVGGNIRVRNPRDNLLTELQNLEYGLTIAVGRRIRSGVGILPIVSGAFGAFRRDAVEAVGGNDPGPGNDSDLTIKMRKLGYRVAFAPQAVCLTNVPTRLGKLFRQRRRWSRNLIKNRIFKHGDIFDPLQEIWRPANMLSSLDSVFFHVVLVFTSLFYLVDLAVHYPVRLPFILVGNYALYLFAELVEVAILLGFSERKAVDARSVLYLPLFHPYKRMLKVIRVWAYVEELLFKVSYLDPFAPAKVRREMPRW